MTSLQTVPPAGVSAICQAQDRRFRGRTAAGDVIREAEMAKIPGAAGTMTKSGYANQFQRPECPAQTNALLLGSVKKNVAPRPGAASAQSRPPCRSITRLTVASPMPVPANSPTACRR